MILNILPRVKNYNLTYFHILLKIQHCSRDLVCFSKLLAMQHVYVYKEFKTVSLFRLFKINKVNSSGHFRENPFHFD